MTNIDQRQLERVTQRYERAWTELERVQILRNESLLALAARLGITHKAIYRLVGRGGSYRGRQNGWTVDSNIIEAVSADTGIPIGQLYEEAALAARKRSGNGSGCD